MNIYAISGLGADQRVFKYLSLPVKLIPLHWLEPEPDEDLPHYAQRMCAKIDTSEPFILMGLSFGGMVASEMNKYLKPEKTILISSAATAKELPWFYIWAGRLRLLSFIPKALFVPPLLVALYLFDTAQSKLMKGILDDTDRDFAKWAMIELCNWKNQDVPPQLVRIHGSSDKMMAIDQQKADYLIPQGGHFMIVDRAAEVSEAIEEVLNKST